MTPDSPAVSPVPPTAESEKLIGNAMPEFVVPITRQIHANADDPTEAFLIQGLSSSTVQGDWVSRLQQLVDEQAEDEGLWCEAANIVEAYLQQELRRLHAAIESRGPLSDPKLIEIHSHVQTLRTVIEEEGQTYTPEGMVIFLRSLLRDFETLLSRGRKTSMSLSDAEEWPIQSAPWIWLRRIGWLDQKGRVWTEIPPQADFDGGSLTPLLFRLEDKENLRAQPLTREGIDAVIDNILESNPTTEVARITALGAMAMLRDALLDSLADGETK